MRGAAFPALIQASALSFLGQVAGAEGPAPVTPISSRAITTLSIPGYVDFLAPDGRAVWVTNEGRVEKLVHESSVPVAVVPVPNPCGAMTVAFGSLWVANCKGSDLYRIDLQSRKVTARIPAGLADPEGELSLAAGAGSIWVLTDPNGVLSPHRSGD